MREQGKISSFQFFCLLTVCRVIAFFTFIITDKKGFSPGDRAILFVPFAIFGLLFSVPALIVIGKEENGTLFDISNSLSPKITKLAAVLYTLGGLWSAAVSTARFELFMSTVMYPGAQLFGFIALLAAAAVLIAKRGLETAGRTALAVTLLIGVSLLFVSLTNIGNFDYTNLSPPLTDGAAPFLKSGFFAAARTSETAALLVLAPKINGKIKKGLGIWFLTLGVTISALFFLISGVTGEYGEKQTFQLYSLTVLSKIGVIERPDALICAVWVLCSLLRLAFYMYTCAQFLEGGFRFKSKTAVYAVFSAAVLALYAFLSESEETFSEVLSSGANEAIFAALLAAFPAAVLAADRIKKLYYKRKRAAH